MTLANTALEGKKHHLNFQLSGITISLDFSKDMNQLRGFGAQSLIKSIKEKTEASQLSLTWVVHGLCLRNIDVK